MHAANYGVYGVRKMHHVMRRADWQAGRNQVGRLMWARALAGVRRTPPTTRKDQALATPRDLMQWHSRVSAGLSTLPTSRPRPLGGLSGLIHHSDHGSNYLSVQYTDRVIELATLQWVSWWSTQRLHSELSYRTPVEIETEFNQTTKTL